MATDITEAIRRIEALRAEAEANQLAVYCSCVMAQLVDPDAPQGQCLGLEAASALPIEKLRELFEVDDFGSAWELLNGEQHEWYEQDAGEIRALDRALAILRGETAPTAV